MTAGDVVGMVSVFFAGLLAGEEFVIRYGVRGPLASLEDGPHILFRQALIRHLRVLVPSIYLATLLSAVIVEVAIGDRAALEDERGAVRPEGTAADDVAADTHLR